MGDKDRDEDEKDSHVGLSALKRVILKICRAPPFPRQFFVQLNDRCEQRGPSPYGEAGPCNVSAKTSLRHSHESTG